MTAQHTTHIHEAMRVLIGEWIRVMSSAQVNSPMDHAIRTLIAIMDMYNTAKTTLNHTPSVSMTTAQLRQTKQHGMDMLTRGVTVE